MGRYFSSSQNNGYMPLDDTDDFHQDLSMNNVIQDTVDDNSEHNTVAFSSRLRIPRLNFAYFRQKFGNDMGKRNKRILDLTICFSCLIMIIAKSVGMGYHAVFVVKPSLVIDKSYRAFRIPNHEASLNFGAFKAARKNDTPLMALNRNSIQWLFQQRGRRSSGDKLNMKERYSRKLEKRSAPGNILITSGSQTFPAWRMQVVFMTEQGDNIFTKERLYQIHDIEKKIISHEQFPDFCFKDPRSDILQDPAVRAREGCAPLNSLMTYFFPSKDEAGNIYYDGLGENMDNIDSALQLAMSSSHFYYFVDDKVNASYKKSQLLRTEVLFGAPLKGYGNWYMDREEQSKKFKEFVISYINILSQSSSSDVSVLYGGQEIFDYEVEMTFWSDVKLAIYAFVAICLLMLILTSGSIWLTFWGLISILMSAPLAIFYYRVVFKIVGLGILNGAAAFVIIGIGVDDVFVFINVFRQANHLTEARARTVYTIKTAGKATFFTSFTTAAAFAANIASMIPAVHDFGLFMALIVANCWITVMLVMPPVLYIWYISFRVCEAKIASLICFCVPSRLCSNLTLPTDIAHFMSSSHGNNPQVTISREVTAEDADVPMLSLDDPPLFHVDNEDEEMIHVDPDPLYVPEEEAEPKDQDKMGVKLQALLYYGMALPFIKARWVIIAISFALLCVSVGLMTQLKTSTEPPQFFRADTNIQKLLNLKSKFSSIDTIKCNDCSGIYNIQEVRHDVTPAPMPWKPKPTQPQTRVTPPPNWTTHKTMSPPPTRSQPTTEKVTRHPETPRPPKPTTAAPMTARPWQPHNLPPERNYTPKPTKTGHQTPPTPKSVPENFDVCKDNNCGQPQARPLLESGATVYVVLGVKNFNWSETDVGHVLSDDIGQVEFDTKFSSAFNFSNPKILDHLAELCTVCKKIAANTKLVRNGSAQCLPLDSMTYDLRLALLQSVEECKDLPQVSYIYGGIQPAHAVGGLTTDGVAILWLGFAFETTTSKSESYFEAYKEYLEWEDFLKGIKKGLDPNSPLQDMFQTSEFWPEVLMEVVAVNSAMYGVVLSMIICMVAVMVFTRHVMLLLIIFISIIEMVCLVVGIFYVLGWEIGGVEAISLSILVGSSVDYCVHLVEGYILAAEACPIKDNAAKSRQWRAGAAFSHIGMSVISSALTTIIAAVPLTQTAIQPFAKFGQIIAINTSVCIIYSLTLCTALLGTIAPAYFKPTWKSTLKSVIGTCIVIGSSVLVMFIITKAGVNIPGPNGGALFSD